MATEGSLQTRTVAIWLALFFVLGLGLRVGMNVDASFDEETGRYLYSGNDPYYHDRVVRHITETGESMVFDEGINYPNGALNPNPPLYDWTTALVAGVLDTAGVEDAEGVALNSMVALWGALTVIPVYFIAASLFSRHAGLWAAGLMSVSAPHIQRGVWGFADHDATTMFFITLALAFMIKGLKSLDDREYVKDWRHGNALAQGLKNSFRHNQTAMLWSALAGVALSATALTWKGYPYVLAVMAVAVGFQLLWDHVKNRDSTAMFSFYLIPMIMVTLIPLPYYMVYESFMDTTIWAGIYVLIGVLIVGAILVPTRDLPSILVFPALALAGAIGLVLMLVVFKDIGQTIFTGLGYFEQSKLFTTIAEAQRSELGRVAASFGFFTFLLAFWGLARSFKKAWAGSKTHMLMVSWALVAIFMAFAASRFIMNAAPVFAILSGGVIVTLVASLRLSEVRQRFRRQHGQNPVGAGLRSLTGRSVVGSLLIAMFLVVPNAWLGVDAAIPFEDDADKERLGAFGIDFDVKDNGWLEAFNALAELDQDQSFEDRPGFIAWWDYGHWATNLGQHPTVADPFQNHYNVAGRFLASESEQEGTAWLALLVINADYHDDGKYSPEMAALLRDIDESLLELGPMRGYDAELALLESHVSLQGDGIFELYDNVSDASGKTVGYFGSDIRMYPFNANRPGIFYAPAFLANKNPDDFIAYSYAGQGLNLQVQQYGEDADGNSFRRDVPKTVDASGREYIVSGGQAFPADQEITATTQGTAVQFQMAPTDLFYNTMYARGFGNDRNGFVPGEGMSHWRAIHQSDSHSVILMEYYRGVHVSGTVVDDAGSPVAGVEVAFVDGFGAGHDTAVTANDGSFSIIAPFSDDGDLELVVRSGTTRLAATDEYQFTKDQAMFRDTVTGAQVVVERGSVGGMVFDDVDGDGVFGANDTALSGATVTVGSQTRTTSASGTFNVTGLQPGQLDVMVTYNGYTDHSRTVTLAAGEHRDLQVSMNPAPSAVDFTLEDQNGDVLTAGIPFTVEGEGVTRNPTTNATGQASLSLQQGDYTVTVDYEVTEGSTMVRYEADMSFNVAFGGADKDVTVTVTRTNA